MVAYQHPSSLGVFQRYKQATAILKNTSRASNPAWYRDPFDLDYQWHIRHDGTSCIACFFDKETGQWSQALSLPDALLQDPEQRKAFIASSIRDAQLKLPKPIGVIVYLANDFATNELKSELDNPGALPDLRQTAASDPSSILEDSSLDTANNSFRILPLPAAQDAVATAVTHTRLIAPLLDDIRQVAEKAAHPVVAKAVSAPLITLMGLPALISPSPGKPFVAILQYSWFTVLAFFNEHKNLMLLRTIQHKGIRRVGSLRSALTASCASLEILDPDLYIFPLTEQQDLTTEDRLRSVAPTSQILTVHANKDSNALPDYCAEPMIALSALAPQSEESLGHTFATLRTDGWALQDFLPMPEAQSAIYPEQSDMRLLKIIRRSRVIVVILALAITGYLVSNMYQVTQQPEWLINDSQANISKVQVSKLSAEQQLVYHWNNLLEDRSKGWIAMELLSRLATENRGLLIRSFSHVAKPENASGQRRIGFTREWKINGFARDEAVQFLNHLNTRDGTDEFFTEIGETSENTSYLPKEGDRTITINMRTLENSSFKLESLEQAILTDDSSYPFTFDLTITQRFESTDPMALNTTKAP